MAWFCIRSWELAQVFWTSWWGASGSIKIGGAGVVRFVGPRALCRAGKELNVTNRCVHRSSVIFLINLCLGWVQDSTGVVRMILLHRRGRSSSFSLQKEFSVMEQARACFLPSWTFPRSIFQPLPSCVLLKNRWHIKVSS